MPTVPDRIRASRHERLHCRFAYQAPATIQVVRPERTVVRTVDEVLPLVLSGAALLLALFGLGVVMTRTGTTRRLVGRAP